MVDPRRTGSAQWADGWLGIDVGTDIALSNTMAREIIHAGLHNVEFIERATTGFDEYAASVEPWTLERGERETGVPADPIRDAGPCLRERRPRDDLLDARDHRAPQRRRQRLLPDQPRPADRARRPLRLGPQPAARPEQRAGRRRHGRDPEQAAGLPGHRERPRSTREYRAGVGGDDPAEVRLAPDPDVRGDGARRPEGALRRRREPGAVGGRRGAHDAPARIARPPRRPGHLPDAHRRDRRRRAARVGELVRGGGNGHEQRAARAASPARARPAGAGARRHRDRLRDRGASRSRLGPARPRRRSGTSCVRCRRCTRG